MKGKKWWLVLYLVSFIIIFSPSILKIDNSIFEKVAFSIGGLVLFISITGLLKSAYFNKNEQFNKDSLYIFLSCLLPLVPLPLETIIGAVFPDTHKYLKDFATFSAVIIIVLSLYFWIIYLNRCIKAIVEIRKDKFFFSIKMIRLMLNAILVCFSATVIIWFLPNKQIVLKSIYQVVNVFINAMYPFIDMYTYVRSEIDEFNKEEKNEIEKNKIGKKQFNDVEQFINSFANSDDLNDLDYLEKNINKKRKKLEKGKFAGVKKIVKICVKKIVEICDKENVKKFVEICDRRNAKINAKIYVKKFATLEDLDNLEKIIVEKRNELENNNDTEKRMD